MTLLCFLGEFPRDNISFPDLRGNANESESLSDDFTANVDDDPQIDYSLVSPERTQAPFHYSQVIRSNTEVGNVEHQNVLVFDRTPVSQPAQSAPSSSCTVRIRILISWWTSMVTESFHLQPLTISATAYPLVPYSRSPSPELEGSSSPVSDEVSMQISHLRLMHNTSDHNSEQTLGSDEILNLPVVWPTTSSGDEQEVM